MAEILVVDDDDAIRGWLVAVLRSARHTVRSFGSAEEALPQIRKTLPDLVVSDIRLPGKSGLELLETLRADPPTATLPLILITSVGHRQIFRKGMELGADDFITKPLAVEEVTRAVDARLARAHAQSAGERVRSAVADPAALPARIGRFRIEKRLARGVGTQVLLGRDQSGVQAAIKMLGHAADEDRDVTLERFAREIETAGAVRHPNLAAVLDRGLTADGEPWVAFEFFPMGDLAGFLTQGIAPHLACRIVGQVAAGLGALHGAGIVHRDVKPANIMVRSANAFVVTDFGTAKRVRVDTTLTPDGRVVGTPSYVSPEQITRKPLGPQTDIYSLGVVFHEMLCGNKPFAGADFHQVLHSHVMVPAPPLPTRLARFQPVVDRMLAKDPAARFATTDELIEAVNALSF